MAEKSNPISLNCLPSRTRSKKGEHILCSRSRVKARKRENVLFRLDRRLIFHEFIGNLELILLVFFLFYDFVSHRRMLLESLALIQHLMIILPSVVGVSKGFVRNFGRSF